MMKFILTNTIIEEILKKYYLIHYPTVGDKSQMVVRPNHGALHVSRVTLYIPILANLYRKYNDREAGNLNYEDLEITKLAALLHDSMREQDGEDKWEVVSAINCYLVMLQYKINRDKAQEAATAIVNHYNDKIYHIKFKEIYQIYLVVQNIYEEDYYKFIAFLLKYNKDRDANLITTSKKENVKHSIYTKLINNADSLDIMRCAAGRVYDAKLLLGFYKQYILNKQSEHSALRDIGNIIIEIRALIAAQHDLYVNVNNKDFRRKIYRYQNEYCYKLVQNDLLDKKLQLINLSTLFNKGKLLSRKELKKISKTTLQRQVPGEDAGLMKLMREGRIYTRSVINPNLKQDDKAKSFMEKEMDKTLKLQELGNEERSVVMQLPGINTYAKNFLILKDISNLDILSIYACNYMTGRGKNKNYKYISSDDKDKNKKLLSNIANLGGSSLKPSRDNINEIIANLRKENLYAIGYNNDRNARGGISNDDINQLQSLYTQSLIKTKYNLDLPIYHYAWSNGTFYHKIYDDAQIIRLWEKIADNFINGIYQEELEVSLQSLKTIISKNELIMEDLKHFDLLDKYYSEKLKIKLNQALVCKLLFASEYRKLNYLKIINKTRTSNHHQILALSNLQLVNIKNELYKDIIQKKLFDYLYYIIPSHGKIHNNFPHFIKFKIALDNKTIKEIDKNTARNLLYWQFNANAEHSLYNKLYYLLNVDLLTIEKQEIILKRWDSIILSLIKNYAQFNRMVDIFCYFQIIKYYNPYNYPDIINDVIKLLKQKIDAFHNDYNPIENIENIVTLIDLFTVLGGGDLKERDLKVRLNLDLILDYASQNDLETLIKLKKSLLIEDLTQEAKIRILSDPYLMISKNFAEFAQQFDLLCLEQENVSQLSQNFPKANFLCDFFYKVGTAKFIKLINNIKDMLQEKKENPAITQQIKIIVGRLFAITNINENCNIDRRTYFKIEKLVEELKQINITVIRINRYDVESYTNKVKKEKVIKAPKITNIFSSK